MLVFRVASQLAYPDDDSPLSVQTFRWCNEVLVAIFTRHRRT